MENCETNKVETIGGTGDQTVGNGSITNDNEDEPVALTGDDFNTNANYDPFGLDSIDEVYTVTETVEVTTPDVIKDDSSDDEGGMSAAGKTFLWLFIIFIVIPALLVLACYLIVKYRPESPAGKEIQRRYTMYKEMAAKEYARRQELRRERQEANILTKLNR